MGWKDWAVVGLAIMCVLLACVVAMLWTGG